MRTGAIFARGSCRALKWMALVGMVFTLGAGSAAAQATPNLPDTVREGTRLAIDANVDITVDEDNFTGGNLTISVTIAPASTADDIPADVRRKGLTVGEASDFGSSLTGTITIVLPATQKSGTVRGRVSFDTETDEDAEDEYFTVTYGAPAPPTGVTDGDGDSFEAPEAGAIIIADRHEQEFVWQNADGQDIDRADLEEDGDVTVTLVARPALTQATYDTHFRMSDDRYMIGVADHEFATGATNSVDITIEAPENDGNRIEDSVTLTAYKAGTSTDRAMLPITVADSDPLEVLRPRLQTEIDAAVSSARARRVGSDGRWTRSDSSISVQLAELFHLPEVGYRVTASVDVDDTDTIRSSGIANSDQGDFLYLWPGDAGTATVTVVASAEEIASSATMQLTDMSAQVEFTLTVDAPEPRQPGVLTTDAVIKTISIDGAEKRRIGGEERLHIEEGARTEVSMTVEWSVGQLRELYDLDSTPDPVVIYFDTDPAYDSADWLSPVDLSGVSQDFVSGGGMITIKIPKLPAASKKDHERVEGKGSDRLNVLEDDDAEDEAFTVEVAANSMGVSRDRSQSVLMTDTVVIDDGDTQGIEIKRITKGDIFESGADQEFEVSADPELVDLALEVDFDLRTSDGSDVPRAYGRPWRNSAMRDRQDRSRALHWAYGHGQTPCAGAAAVDVGRQQRSAEQRGQPVLRTPESGARRGRLRRVRRGAVREVLRGRRRPAELAAGPVLPDAAPGLLRRTRFRAGDCLAGRRFVEPSRVPRRRAPRSLAGPLDGVAHAAADRPGDA